MALPWFPFNIKAYISDTMRLTTEQHGAYLLLILDYYATETPPPDDDEVLASITKLPVETWKRHRRVLAPLFQIENCWRHKVIDEVIHDGHLKHSLTVAKAVTASQAAKAAREARKTGKDPARTPARTPPRPPKSKMDIIKDALTDSPKDTVERPQEQEHPNITLGGESTPPKAADEALEEQISADFEPSQSTLVLYQQFSADEIAVEVRKFIAYHGSRGTFSINWQANFATWLEREIAFRTKETARENAKAPPRVVVNNEYEPTEADWEKAVVAYKRNESHWPRWAGNSPGAKSCRCPPAILERHGWDAELKRFVAPAAKEA